jgi:Glycosyl hydrolase family 3 N terminal domain
MCCGNANLPIIFCPIRVNNSFVVYDPFVIQVCRDPRWGRCYESYSEDTEIVRQMTELIPGLQGDLPPNMRKGVPYVAGGYDASQASYFAPRKSHHCVQKGGIFSIFFLIHSNQSQQWLGCKSCGPEG